MLNSAIVLMQVQRTTKQLWLAVSESGSWLQCVGLLRRGARYRDRLRRGAWCGLLCKGARCRVRLRRGAWRGWLNEELTSVAQGQLDFVSCFCFGLSIGRRDHVDAGCLDVGF